MNKVMSLPNYNNVRRNNNINKIANTIFNSNKYNKKTSEVNKKQGSNLLNFNFMLFNDRHNNNYYNNINYHVNYINKEENENIIIDTYNNTIQNNSRKRVGDQRLKMIKLNKENLNKIIEANNLDSGFNKKYFSQSRRQIYNNRKYKSKINNS